jgi:Protein of unknown function (DUF1569)
MALPNIFSKDVNDDLIARINKLTKDTKPQWGKMNVAQMLAHCCVTYQYVYEPQTFKKPNFVMQWVLRTFVKPGVVNEVPYKHNIRTGPDFIIADVRDFEKEKSRLIHFLKMSQQDGEQFFEGKESFSFGPLKVADWNNMFYKHLDHHLTQFGV